MADDDDEGSGAAAPEDPGGDIEPEPIEGDGAMPLTLPQAADKYYPSLAGFALRNPGVLFDSGKWYVLRTGRWNKPLLATTTDESATSWVEEDKKFLEKTPEWMSKENNGVWAPSILKKKDGTGYVVYFAGLVKGSKQRRCIGAATAKAPEGPFEPDDRALACYEGSGAQPRDPVESKYRISLIDPTPARVGDSVWLTYKVQRKAGKTHFVSTTRLLELNPDNPSKPRDNATKSRQITQHKGEVGSDGNAIEENPVLVHRGDRFMLFTSVAAMAPAATARSIASPRI